MNSNVDENWSEINKDWAGKGTNASQLSAGVTVSGVVVSRAPFGMWIDIGADVLGLIVVPDIEGGYDSILERGATIRVVVHHVSEDRKISLKPV